MKIRTENAERAQVTIKVRSPRSVKRRGTAKGDASEHRDAALNRDGKAETRHCADQLMNMITRPRVQRAIRRRRGRYRQNDHEAHANRDDADKAGARKHARAPAHCPGNHPMSAAPARQNGTGRPIGQARRRSDGGFNLAGARIAGDCQPRHDDMAPFRGV